ncbi:ChaN family lipoprotein [Prosthecochloris sp. HL-130-GSB]|uniref:ChaN family lipoprotein n=1 Tax=Prosthecochloris sp. HL-130-GSB TaxID=1974213 RepID=UPI000A1C07A2|nr:ChaN family lipoprotein [Prosthecochloris sp. HL-130-GSB]ARM30813.1 iron-regulated protein [Prosthecochloris sp. HL-130-GSB]
MTTRLRHLLLLIVLSCISIPASGKDLPAYKLYNAAGKEVSYRKLYKKAKKADIIMFGELHSNPIAHWLRLELVKDLLKSGNVMLGAEMFETDNQQALDEYLHGSIDAADLDSLARLWPNYSTDYAPIVNLAKKHEIPVIATNIPRRFASMVYKQGDFTVLERLDDEEKAWIAPLPILFDPELPQYKKILTMDDDHGSPELVKAQAIKDATMAHFILRNYRPGHTFLHLNGAYHSDFHEGIVYYLKAQNESLHIMTISTVEQENVHRLEDEHEGRADFIICVDEDMTKTH